MKKLIYSFRAKVIAVIILLILVILSFLCNYGILLGRNLGVYNSNVDSYYDSLVFEDTSYTMANKIVEDYIYANDWFEREYSAKNTNLRFSISTKNDPETILFTNYDKKEDVKIVGKYLLNQYWVELSVSNPITVQDEFYQSYQMFNFIYPLRYTLYVILALIAVLFIADIIFLFASVGHKKGSDEIQLNKFDKIPFDLVLLGGLIIYGLFDEFHYLFYYPPSYLDELLALYGISIGFATIILITGLSFAVRVKKGVLVKELFVIKLLKWIEKGAKKAASLVNKFFRMMPYIWQVALLSLTVFAINLFLIECILSYYYYDLVFIILYIIFNIIIFLGICFGAYQMSQLKKAGERMAQGDFETDIRIKGLFGPFKEHGKNLSEIGNGMTIAVEQRMKSEHLKTELITNVSHDIKTPLTSIINYVDLMKEENVNNQHMKDYLAIVDRQSIRLKKLLEDLVEVSKASTGNLVVENTPCELNILLGQLVGEYKEKLEDKKLDIIVDVPEQPLVILGDGRHLWRIFDNLLNNIYKYSQENTRVYLTLEKEEDKAILTFRNISKYALNISSDELLERFVRGDKSRHTEGSGLGLSIARNLTELQRGSMDVVIDGDLFKVILAFNLKE